MNSNNRTTQPVGLRTLLLPSRACSYPYEGPPLNRKHAIAMLDTITPVNTAACEGSDTLQVFYARDGSTTVSPSRGDLIFSKKTNNYQSLKVVGLSLEKESVVGVVGPGRLL